MSHLQVIARLEDMLRMALEIVNEQAQLLEQHGIETADGKLEAAEVRLKEEAEKLSKRTVPFDKENRPF